MREIAHEKKITVNAGLEAGSERVQFAEPERAVLGDGSGDMGLELRLAKGAAGAGCGDQLTHPANLPGAGPMLRLGRHGADIVEPETLFERAVGVVKHDIGDIAERAEDRRQFHFQGVDARFERGAVAPVIVGMVGVEGAQSRRQRRNDPLGRLGIEPNMRILPRRGAGDEWK